jgi:hypothetical protein
MVGGNGDLLSATSPMPPSWMSGGKRKHRKQKGGDLKEDVDNLTEEADIMNKMKVGQLGGDIKTDLATLQDEADVIKQVTGQLGGKRRSKKGSKKSSKKSSKKHSKKSSKKHSKKSSKKHRSHSQKGGRDLPEALKKYRAIVEKVDAMVKKAGIELKGVVLINSYVGKYNRQAKEAGASDIEKFVIQKVESDLKDIPKLKQTFKDFEKAAADKKAEKKAKKLAQ